MIWKKVTNPAEHSEIQPRLRVRLRVRLRLGVDGLEKGVEPCEKHGETRIRVRDGLDCVAN